MTMVDDIDSNSVRVGKKSLTDNTNSKLKLKPAHSIRILNLFCPILLALIADGDPEVILIPITNEEHGSLSSKGTDIESQASNSNSKRQLICLKLFSSLTKHDHY